jgi:hypothetical protein
MDNQIKIFTVFTRISKSGASSFRKLALSKRLLLILQINKPTPEMRVRNFHFSVSLKARSLGAELSPLF